MSDLRTRILEVEADDNTGRLARALEAVAELHKPYEWSFGYEPVTSCMHCASLGMTEESAEYPCPTVQAIQDELGSDDE